MKVAVIVSIAVIVSVGIAAYGVVNLIKMGRETQQTIEETAEEAQKRLEPPKIINVDVEEGSTKVTISWTTTKSVPCTLEVERLGAKRFSGLSTGTSHEVIVRGLLPRKEYSFVIECQIGSDYYEGAFKTEDLI